MLHAHDLNLVLADLTKDNAPIADSQSILWWAEAVKLLDVARIRLDEPSQAFQYAECRFAINRAQIRFSRV